MENNEEKLVTDDCCTRPLTGWAVIPAKCTGCGECVDACGRLLLKIEDRRLVNVKPTGCNLCGDCADACGYDAISLT